MTIKLSLPPNLSCSHRILMVLADIVSAGIMVVATFYNITSNGLLITLSGRHVKSIKPINSKAFWRYRHVHSCKSGTQHWYNASVERFCFRKPNHVELFVFKLQKKD